VSRAGSDEEVVAATQAWLERDVIGLNLCPFARAVSDAGRIRYFVSRAETGEGLRTDLVSELRILETLDPAKVDTTLLIHPSVFGDFPDYNDFLGVAEAAVEELGFAGVFQIASFHPTYRFAGTAPEDVTNRTNRSPYPMLHILREASIARAVAGHPDAAGIPARNIETLRRLGAALTPAVPPLSPRPGPAPRP